MPPLRDSFSEREQVILRLLAEGLSDRQIAQELFLSLNTVKWYNRQIYRKLGVSSRTQAIAHAKTLSLLGEGVSISPSFDTVTSSLSTCTFPDPIQTLQKMKRVCRPDGLILLLEHGHSSLPWLADFQDRNVLKHYQENAGCRWNQDPLDLIQAAGLKVQRSKRAVLGIFYVIEAMPG